MTRYPKSGKGRKWTIAELKAITPDWRADVLADGDCLSAGFAAFKLPGRTFAAFGDSEATLAQSGGFFVSSGYDVKVGGLKSEVQHPTA